jgi:chromosome segregation ATPase
MATPCHTLMFADDPIVTISVYVFKYITSNQIEILPSQGIRSVGPNDPVRIKFFKPLTVIVGQNGSGKTTLIEALRYATTGDFPPNARASFVHDPKLTDSTTVNAQVTIVNQNDGNRKDDKNDTKFQKT